MKKIVAIVLFLAFAAALTGCAAFGKGIEEEEVIEAPPCTDPVLNICLNVVDKRWCKEGGYGVDRISIYIKEDLGIKLKAPMIDIFQKHNYNNTECGARVEIEIEQFFCDVIEHRSSWNCASELIFQAKVLKGDGEELYSKRIRGIAENDFEKAERFGKAKKSLISALEDAMANLFEEPRFRRAVKIDGSLQEVLQNPEQQ